MDKQCVPFKGKILRKNILKTTPQTKSLKRDRLSLGIREGSIQGTSVDDYFALTQIHWKTKVPSGSMFCYHSKQAIFKPKGMLIFIWMGQPHSCWGKTTLDN